MSYSEYPDPIGRACGFLWFRYNPYLGLLAETPGSRTYYVASDNLLAQRAMIDLCSQGTPDMGDLIRSAVTQNSCCNQGNDTMHETVLGLPIPLPIRAGNTYDVTSSWYDPTGNFTVYYENHNGTEILSDAQYGDVAAYAALELERAGNHTGALHEIAILNWMYDGRGIADDVYRYGGVGEQGVYQTFKTALYMLALAETDQWIPPSLEKTILSMQGADGGFYTGYDYNGDSLGTLENVETTSIAVLALHALPARIRIEPLSYHNVTSGGSVGTAKVQPLLYNLENWTVTFDVTVYWDNTTEIIGSGTVTDLSPRSSDNRFLFVRNVTFNPEVSHFVRIYAGNSSTVLTVYTPQELRPLQLPWWENYWYIFLGPIIIAMIFTIYYRRHSKNSPPRI